MENAKNIEKSGHFYFYLGDRGPASCPSRPVVMLFGMALKTIQRMVSIIELRYEPGLSNCPFSHFGKMIYLLERVLYVLERVPYLLELSVNLLSLSSFNCCSKLKALLILTRSKTNAGFVMIFSSLSLICLVEICLSVDASANILCRLSSLESPSS